MTTMNETIPAPLRVLVVENDPHWRADHLKNLTDWGFGAWAAEPADDAADQFQSLWDDAIAKARRYRCHLALVDMRLRNDDDESDTSGLRLVPHLAPTVSIIVSGKGDVKTVRAALKLPPDVPERAYDFVGKEEGPETLLDAIREVENTIWCRRAIEIARRAEPYSVALIERLFPGDDTVPTDEVDDILRRLFPTARRLKVEEIGREARVASQPRIRSSVVLKVTEDNYDRPVVVKLAYAGELTREANRFTAARGLLFGEPFARPYGEPVELWNIGGMVYELLGGDQAHQVMPFEDYYKMHGPADVQEVLGRVVEALLPLYQIKAALPDNRRMSLLKAYGKLWGDNWLEHLSKSIWVEMENLDHRDLLHQFGLVDPISWLVKRTQLVESRQIGDNIPHTDIVMIHGDLHGGNFFVDTLHNVWVIDFEYTGFGPILQDFAKLEMDILTRLIPTRYNTHEYLELVLAVTRPFDSSRPIEATARVLNSPETRKALYAVKEIKRQAAEVIGYYDQREHLWCLLLNAVASLRILQPENASYNRLLLFGRVICHRLDHWADSDWPPPEWLAALDLAETEWVSEDEQRARDRYVEYLQREWREAKSLDEKKRLGRRLQEFGEEVPSGK